MTGLRTFPDEVEAVAAEWRAGVQTSDVWSPITAAGSEAGISEGYLAECNSHLGFLKPTVLRVVGLPVAAHEKIAADLALDLMLAVPPVQLVEDYNGTVRYKAVSLVAFKPVFKWGTVALTPQGALVAKSMVASASAMVVFDNWLDNLDRHNLGNLVIGIDGAGPTYRHAYIDFAHSLLYSWRTTGGNFVNPLVDIFPQTISVDFEVMGKTLLAVENLDQQEIDNIVDRVPDGFLQDDQKVTIKSGLQFRRAGLRKVLEAKYGISL